MNKFIQPIDDWLNCLTMYRLLLYGLGVLAAVALSFAMGGVITLDPVQMGLSLGVLIGAAYVSNVALSVAYQAARNYESWLITALILFFVLPPARNAMELAIWALAAGLAMASKYVLAPWRKHIFNPAAFGAAAIGILGLGYGSWWIGTASLLPFSLILAVLTGRKIRRLQLVGLFWAVSLLTTAVLAFSARENVSEMLQLAIVSGPLVFMGGIMLTEPATMPHRRRWQLVYAGMVGVLLATHLNLGFIYITPEIALLAGNTLAYVVSPKRRLRLQFVKSEQLAETIFEYIFKAPSIVAFAPGQYAEWTLPHRHTDSRGNRRTFSLASAPGSQEVRLAVKQSPKPSSFKVALTQLKPGDSVELGPACGDFVLPPGTSTKTLLVAGGVGITPFASMLRQFIASGQKRDAILYYVVGRAEDRAYQELLALAQANDIRVHTMVGRLDVELLQAAVPDMAERHAYVSGAPGMVRAATRALEAHGVPAHHIHTDYFSGY